MLTSQPYSSWPCSSPSWYRPLKKSPCDTAVLQAASDAAATAAAACGKDGCSTSSLKSCLWPMEPSHLPHRASCHKIGSRGAVAIYTLHPAKFPNPKSVFPQHGPLFATHSSSLPTLLVPLISLPLALVVGASAARATGLEPGAPCAHPPILPSAAPEPRLPPVASGGCCSQNGA